MLNSVCLHVQSILDGLTIPFQDKPLEAWVQPPAEEKPVGPKAYIWGATGSWKRQTMPRGPGFQEFDWPLSIFLALLTSTQLANIDQHMNALVDAVVSALLTAEMPVMITDPATGQETQLWQIGEAGKIDNPPGRLPEDLRMLQYNAVIDVTVKEVVQA